MLHEVKLGILVKNNSEPVLREALNLALLKSLSDRRLVKEVKIKLGKWREKEYLSDSEDILSNMENTKIIVETIYE